MDLGGNQREKNHEGFMHTPHQIPKRKASKTLQENCQEKAPKITKKNEREQHIQSLEEPRQIIYTSQSGSYKV
jgi:6-phosphogluconate dehydrogenase